MKLHTGAFAALSLVVAVAAPAMAADTARDFNVVVSGNFNSSNSDVEGWVAAGGNIDVANFSIGLQKPATAGHYAAVAGGTFTGGNGQVYGDTLASGYAGNYTWVNGGAAKTYAGGNAATIDIASEMTRLSQLSASLAAHPETYGTVGTTQLAYNQLFLVGSDEKLNIFNVSAADWADTKYGWHLATKAGSLTVINISGLSSSIANSGSDNSTYNGMSVGFAAQGYDSTRVLYNFAEATSLNATGSVNATILAPMADFVNTYGAVNGQVFVKNFLGHVQVNQRAFKSNADGTNLLDTQFQNGGGGTGAVPEPASWAMLIGGFGIVGGVVRRRRRAFAVAA